jgi:uncharacterized protein (TIGR02001 family)
MKQVKILSAAVLLALAGTANAGVTATVTATNDYDFRGFSQSATDPALQGSVDYAHDSGWYIGAWASNVDFGDTVDVDFEVDLYTGFTGKINESASWDAGIVYYAYPDESDFDYIEVYGGVTVGMFKGKLYYSNDFAGLDESAFYLDTNASIPLPNNFSINLHLGYSSGDAIELVAGDDYADYSVGVGYTISNFNLGLKYVDNNADVEIEDPIEVFNNEGRVVFTVSTTFPWK